jgi:hypothetical protein
MRLKRHLDINEILHAADAHREITGSWPTRDSGNVLGMLGETWAGIDQALRDGRRGLPGASTLAQFLAEKRKVRNIKRLPPLTEEKILSWADAHHQRTGTWPTLNSGRVTASDGDRWSAIAPALYAGRRGLPGGSSLAQLLAAHRGVRNPCAMPPFTPEQILAWADEHHARTLTWPTAKSGPITAAPGETWGAVDTALSKGARGLLGGSTLALLLAENRSVRNLHTRPRLSVEQILSWVDAYHQDSGERPEVNSGPLQEAPGETWLIIEKALRAGLRGLPGGSSLRQLLNEHRGVRNPKALPALSVREILAWASAHHKRTGQWPIKKSGIIAEAPEETWLCVDSALRRGSRGLRGGSSLARLLAEHGKKRNNKGRPPFSRKKIVAWAKAYHVRTGEWPRRDSGPVMDAPGESWCAIDTALQSGIRGLAGGSSLRQLLYVKGCGVPNPLPGPPFTLEEILQWAEVHFERGHLAQGSIWPDCRCSGGNLEWSGCCPTEREPKSPWPFVAGETPYRKANRA